MNEAPQQSPAHAAAPYHLAQARRVFLARHQVAAAATEGRFSRPLTPTEETVAWLVRVLRWPQAGSTPVTTAFEVQANDGSAAALARLRAGTADFLEAGAKHQQAIPRDAGAVRVDVAGLEADGTAADTVVIIEVWELIQAAQVRRRFR
jgi:hypothetical protein